MLSWQEPYVQLHHLQLVELDQSGDFAVHSVPRFLRYRRRRGEKKCLYRDRHAMPAVLIDRWLPAFLEASDDCNARVANAGVGGGCG